MRISARGAARHHGAIDFFDHQVRDAKIVPGSTLSRNVLAIDRRATSVEMEAFTSATLTSGNHFITVTLSDEDILHLFLTCYPELDAALKGIFSNPEQPILDIPGTK
jgi:hypothetical protein